ncbi:MAG: hypothetical protein UU88_C0013G0013 [Parcubacteria group bacterium GW2011_GWC1_42_11]|uniref:Serine aminopeptidase S33 domain-containing protein n=1 Tax=Candidatus Nomurabacteria bacterium GW2011_GWC2_42_20 TaxID=1618756 RepID=A0A0G0ZDV6_9BACT|nr:MAG: hypothetical protein UU88_C0013G0013 [Parcubacteria group bacterium GW2011_GWC1_42_11]KKS46910.1 MAG: hypothetical protein UV12_C0015G0004 [Candidatus Nomurabacteria bacterium GW2011_GWC2_42_20]KKS58915.1 MAG: hypothetical protein UV24_C0012G0002 [Candidatus Nomurabacteria bacterium GW2011_GWA2_42_41]KKT08127.1 MAG: hypothetical protein UV86_C0023G0002 [Candidatus Nomurabacteria bacterium GW2011_GWB1_43_20]
MIFPLPQVNSLVVINYDEAIYKIMNFKISSKKIKKKFIYGDFVENKKATTLVVFLSGLSGSRELPFLKVASSEFFKYGFSTVRFNFCNDSDDKHQKDDALTLEELSFSVYVTELKNILDSVGKKYSKIVLVGHSFGAPVAILFLSKYKKYANNTELVLWDPTILPWKKQWMEEDFVFDKDKGLYFGKHTKEVINKVFYGECIRVDTVSILHMLNRNACIIAAKNSADKDAMKYFSKVHKKKTSVLHIIEKTDHYFKGIKAQKELFKTTLNFLDLIKKKVAETKNNGL